MINHIEDLKELRMINHIEEWKLRLWRLITWEVREEKINEVRQAYEEALEKEEKRLNFWKNIPPWPGNETDEEWNKMIEDLS